MVASLPTDANMNLGVSNKVGDDIESLAKRFRDFGFVEMGGSSSDDSVQEGGSGFNLDDLGYIDKRQV